MIKSHLVGETDLDLLTELYRLRLATLYQLAELTYVESQAPSPGQLEYLRRRLAALVEKGYLRVHRERDGFRNTPLKYELTQKGVELALEVLSPTGEEEVRYSAHENRVHPAAHMHHLAVVDVYVALKKAKLPFPWEWVDPRKQSKPYTAKQSLRHDGVIRLAGGEVWLEVDMGTERLNTLTTKLKAYDKVFWSSDVPRRGHRTALVFLLQAPEKRLMGRVQRLREKALEVLQGDLSEVFDVYVDSWHNALWLLKHVVLPTMTKHGPEPAVWFAKEFAKRALAAGLWGHVKEVKLATGDPAQAYEYHSAGRPHLLYLEATVGSLWHFHRVRSILKELTAGDETQRREEYATRRLAVYAGTDQLADWSGLLRVARSQPGIILSNRTLWSEARSLEAAFIKLNEERASLIEGF